MTDQSTVIRLENVSKHFVVQKEKSLKERLVRPGFGRKFREDFHALDDISFDIASGSTVGLIGANGSGKSTLLKVIGGIIEPSEGRVSRRGRLAALLELGAGFHPDLTGRENVYLNAAILGMSRNETASRFDEIVEFSGIEPFIDTQVKFYSSGMYVRLAFAVAVHVDPEILLVDEVLAVGDEPFQTKCLDKIRSFQHEGRTIIIVTHSLSTVGDMCDRGIVMDHGAKIFDGDVSTALHTLRDVFSRDAEERHVIPASARIDSVRLLDATSNEMTSTIVNGQSVKLEVTVSSDVEIAEWVVGMGIEGNLGQAVFGTNTERLDIRTDPFTGSRTVVFDLPNLHLGTDRFTIHASFGTIPGGILEKIPQAVSFDSSDGTHNVGSLSIMASATVR
jgi:ABC-2 type transport system ATP-binding protein